MMPERMRRRPNGHAQQAKRVPREAPAPSPLDVIPSQAEMMEQPVLAPMFFCPAWPGCQAEFADLDAQKQHIRRHAHARP
jgi:hypothetical protein